MAGLGIGSKSYIQFGRETVWGTAVASTKRIGFLSQNIKAVKKQEKDESLTGNHTAPDIVNVMEHAEGQIELNLTYNELNIIFDCLMGTDTFGSNGGTSAGANPYDHTFTDDHDFHNSLTLQLIEGNVPDTKCQRVIGAKIVGATIGFQAAGLVKCTLDVIGKQKQTNQTPTGALSAVAPVYVLSSHLSTQTDGSGDAAADIIIREFEFSMKNGLDASREYAGSDYVGEPLRNLKNVGRTKIRKEFRTVTLLDDYIAGTNNAIAFEFVSGSNFNWKVEAANTRIVNFDHGADGAGILFAEIEYEHIFTSGSPAYGTKLTIGNTQATITT